MQQLSLREPKKGKFYSQLDIPSKGWLKHMMNGSINPRLYGYRLLHRNETDERGRKLEIEHNFLL